MELANVSRYFLAAWKALSWLNVGMNTQGGSPRRAVTLVELLVVVAIIGLLVALLLPAIQSARESARRTTCARNVRQLAQACLSHVAMHNTFPSGGWGGGWVGDADRGFGRSQPGGWIYSTLPFMEQTQVWALGAGLTGSAKNDAHRQRNETLLPCVDCPSRRTGFTPNTSPTAVQSWNPTGYLKTYTNASPSMFMMRSDYAITFGRQTGASCPYAGNCQACLEDGEGYTSKSVGGSGGPGSIAQGDSAAWQRDFDFCQTLNRRRSPLGSLGIGVVGNGTLPAAIRDGLSQTYLCGEKWVFSGAYVNVLTFDSGSAYESSNGRLNGAPQPDFFIGANATFTSGWGGFGSAHPGIFLMAFCDGSVRPVSFSVSAATHSNLCLIADGNPVDLTQLD